LFAQPVANGGLLTLNIDPKNHPKNPTNHTVFFYIKFDTGVVVVFQVNKKFRVGQGYKVWETYPAGKRLPWGY
jgi:hypothetical protein